MELSISHFAVIASILFGAYFVRAVTGFGSALVAVPLLALLLPLSLVVPLIVTLDVIAALALSLLDNPWRTVAWDELGRLIPAAVLGVALGVTLLVGLPEPWLLGGLGLVIIVFGLRSALGVEPRGRVRQWWAWPAGALGGGIGALFAAGGPPFVIYLTHRSSDKRLVRTTLSVLFLIEGTIRVVAFSIVGLMAQPGLLWGLLGSLPLMVLGLSAGNLVHLRVSPARLIHLIGLVLILSGIILLYRAW